MELRLRILSRSELNKAADSRQYLIPLHQLGYEQPVKYAILEQTTSEGSTEGPSWQPVEVSR